MEFNIISALTYMVGWAMGYWYSKRVHETNGASAIGGT